VGTSATLLLDCVTLAGVYGTLFVETGLGGGCLSSRPLGRPYSRGAGVYKRIIEILKGLSGSMSGWGSTYNAPVSGETRTGVELHSRKHWREEDEKDDVEVFVDVDVSSDESDSEDGDEDELLQKIKRRADSTAEEIIVDSFNENLQTGWKTKTLISILQALLVITVVGLGMFGLKMAFPDAADTLKAWASWANDVEYGTLVFAFLAGMILLIPGVPGSLLCFTCGTVFPFSQAFFVAAVGHHLGSCVAFLIARFLCRTRFEKMMLSRPTLKMMSIAAKMEQYKVTFLSRFIVMPVQIKNYLFGVLPVSFWCFFSMAFLGDLQSTLFSVYLGSISSNLLENASQEAGIDMTMGGASSWIPVVSIMVAVFMTTLASIVARRAYLQVLCEFRSEEVATQSGRVITVRKRRKRRPSSFRSASTRTLVNNQD